MANPLAALKVLLPKRSNPKGTANTSTYNPSNPNTVLTVPTYRDHLTDLFDSRASLDSRSLIKELFKHDPDMSVAVNSYLTMANTQPVFLVKDAQNQIDVQGQQILNTLLVALTSRVDYSKGFKLVQTLRSITEELRYMLLLRGGLGAELVISKEFLPAEFRIVDMASVEWYEKTPGSLVPAQTTPDGKEISLDIPTFFVSFYHRDPTSAYTISPFVSAINTIAARQQVINDLYRIMRLTGYPRMDVKVMEEVLIKNAPADVNADPKKKRDYLNTRLNEISQMVTTLRPDQAFIHYDSVEPRIMNEKAPGMAINIDSVISALNAQNQAGLRSMATILGRGESGVNTASVEARIFSMNAEELNQPIADLLSQAFTLAIRLQGSQSRVEVSFLPPELRPETELEAQYSLRQARLLQDLSYGIITDEEYHLKMYHRLPPQGAPKLSGTGFYQGGQGIDPSKASPNSDPLGRSLVPEGGNNGPKDNKVKK